MYSPHTSHVTKFGLDTTYGFWWITCRTLSGEPAGKQGDVQWATSNHKLCTGLLRYLESLEGLKYKQVSLRCGLMCDGNDGDVDR